MKVSRCIRVISPINYWQVFVPHPLRFGYHFVSVYYHLKEHSVNFFWFFKGFLNYSVHPSNYWVFKNAYFQWFFVRIMDLKKKFQDVSLCKKVSAFWKKILLFRSQCKKVLKIENWLWKCVFEGLPPLRFSILYFFLKGWYFFYIRHVIFRLGFARVHNEEAFKKSEKIHVVFF